MGVEKQKEEKKKKDKRERLKWGQLERTKNKGRKGYNFFKPLSRENIQVLTERKRGRNRKNREQKKEA